ncbi:L-threonylcarbamoyladenylate synthase [Peribacillus alkalitolerans]|uniref:L-threonylcarbamoyladenylate synthase n=1 Tax=Peribacillus alkalitolerans TaxID=1550385 RepID=UPI0013D76C66|nr:L-threonylcarbamoyladenylate synthase [Peribacillus alkalitolerans]
METKMWKVDNYVDKSENNPQISQAAQLLKKGEVVAFPTETVYGLGADATCDEAVEKIFKAKGRPSDNPLIVHIAEREQLPMLVEQIGHHAEILMERFWPGPLTLIFKKKEGLSKLVTAGLDTVAVRMPDHPVAYSLIKESGLPIAAPSANTSGKPSPTQADHVKRDLYGKIAGIVDGGETGVGLESTVVDCSEAIPVILRPGGITMEQLEDAVGEVRLDAALANEKETPKSPGMKYTHYAPSAPLTLVKGHRSFIQKQIDEAQEKGLQVGVLTTEENKSFYQADHVETVGTAAQLETVASKLYEALRNFDDYHVDVIFGEVFPEEGIGQAIMNRLMKAAGHRIIVE